MVILLGWLHRGVVIVGILPIDPLSASEIPLLNPYADS